MSDVNRPSFKNYSTVAHEKILDGCSPGNQMTNLKNIRQNIRDVPFDIRGGYGYFDNKFKWMSHLIYVVAMVI